MLTPPKPEKDIQRLYEIFANLEQATGKRILRTCDGRMNWPHRGVYFFFEKGEKRRDGVTARVVRVGTHALDPGGRGKLWNRLRLHRGPLSGGGDHRSSIFRKHVGGALLDRDERMRP